MAVVVVRHADAGKRHRFQGDDRVRPLSPRGRRRADELVRLLGPLRPDEVLSSPYVRCTETVEPLAEAVGVGVERTEELAEGNAGPALELLCRLIDRSAVLCTHGDVALALLEALMPGLDDEGTNANKLQKGDAWVLAPSSSVAGSAFTSDPGGRDGACGRGWMPPLTIVDHLRVDRGRARRSSDS